ncbi:Alkylmercury lyase [Modestobacter sp. DSM 44400]|uniref:organomercurial lyase n=1 Tax=Modestobacter sp. DSM 44400 TaxID=1550230 RepID=UPI0008963492|nr:organomercurial lyase [Modestobacter sp. DSM 44400]SDY92874.1 Alkylmercury lyase [Modestobacter sp. DSM 44400]
MQLLHRRTLLAFGQSGKPPTHDQLQNWAKELHLALDTSLQQLTEAELLFLDHSGRKVSGGVPFASGPTAHRVLIVNGPTVFANCAVDALGMAAMLGRDVDIRPSTH